MHKLQEQTVTQIIIPFVQMIIPFSHLWNGKKKEKKGWSIAYTRVQESHKVWLQKLVKY